MNQPIPENHRQGQEHAEQAPRVDRRLMISTKIHTAIPIASSAGELRVEAEPESLFVVHQCASMDYCRFHVRKPAATGGRD